MNQTTRILIVEDDMIIAAKYFCNNSTILGYEVIALKTRGERGYFYNASAKQLRIFNFYWLLTLKGKGNGN